MATSPQHSREELAGSFNTRVKVLVRRLDVLSGNADITRLKRSMGFLINATPFAFIEDCGPYLWYFRKEINHVKKSHYTDYSQFIDMDYSPLVERNSETQDGGNFAIRVIDLIRDLFRSITEDEKREVLTHVVYMLSFYANYRRTITKEHQCAIENIA